MRPSDIKRLAVAHEALARAYRLMLDAPEEFESPKEFTKPQKPKVELVGEVIRRAPPPESGSSELTKIDRKILVSLAQLNRPASIVTVSLVGSFSQRSSTVDTSLAKLRRQGFVDGAKSALRVTHAGREAIGEYAELPKGHALFEYWRNKLKSPAGKILAELRQRKVPLAIEVIAVRQDFSVRSSTVDTALALLKRLGFVEGGKDALKLTPEFELAIEPGIRIFDRTTGNETLVDPRGHAKR